MQPQSSLVSFEELCNRFVRINLPYSRKGWPSCHSCPGLEFTIWINSNQCKVSDKMQFIATYVTQFCSGFFFSIKNRTKGTSPFPPNSLPSMGSHTWLVAIIVGAFVSLLWWYRWNQRKIPGPNGWPIIGSLPELLANWDRLHDFMVPQFSNAKTMYVQLPFFLTSVYTVDPACVEQLLKTRFENYPKVTTIHYQLFLFQSVMPPACRQHHG